MHQHGAYAQHHGGAYYRHGRTGFWPGAVADVRIFESVLDDAQVRDLMESTRPTTPLPAWPATADGLSVLNGTYEYRMNPAESIRLEEAFGPEAEAAGFPGDGTVVMRFVDGLWQQYFLVDDVPYLLNGQAEGDGGTYAVDGDRVVFNGSPYATYRWTLADDALSLTLLGDLPDDDMVRFVTEHTFTRVAG